MAESMDRSRAGSAGARSETIGKYRVLARLGEGGMGVVYRARDPEVGRDVAIKVLKSSSESDLSFDQIQNHFRQEARSLGSLRHPNIISVFEANYQSSPPYIVMEFIEGETLQAKIERGGRLPPHAALGYLGQIATGLDYAHSQGILHRDIKSSNIMIDRHGQIFILDFGIAELAGKKASSPTNLVLGTPASLAPEQLAGRNTDVRTDLYALGVVAFESLTGMPPFDGNSVEAIAENIRQSRRRTVASLVPGAPPELEKFFHRALAPLKEDRFDSAREMIIVLAQSLGIDPGSVASLGNEKISIDSRSEKPKLIPLSAATPVVSQDSVPDYSNPWRLVAGESNFTPISTRQSGPRRPVDSSDWSDDGRRGKAIDPKISYETATKIGGLILALVLVPLLMIAPKLKSPPPPPVKKAVAGPIVALPPSLDLPSENPLNDLALNDIEIGEPDRDTPLDERDDQDLLATLVSPNSSEPEVLKTLQLAEMKRIGHLPSAAAHLLNYPSHHVRAAAADLLGRLADKRALPYLMISLEDVDTIVRSASAKAIGHLGEKKALGFLTMKFKTESVYEVRTAMKQAIEELNGFPMAE